MTLPQINLLEIIDTTAKLITKQVAKFEIYNIESAFYSEKDLYSLIIKTYGDYEFSIMLYADFNVMYAIARNMKRCGTVSDNDIEEYAKEYYNILCGHLITSINRMTDKKVKFHVPTIIKNMHCVEYADGLCYQSNYGQIDIRLCADVA